MPISFSLTTSAPRVALKRIALLALMVMPFTQAGVAASPSNSITISDKSGAAQNGRPFTISRVFARGEIVNYPQARISGTPIPTQSDVKTRWPDGSVQHVMISFLTNVPASGSVMVDFINQSSGNNTGEMNQPAMLAANWDAQIEVTNGTTLAANAKRILTDWNGTASDQRVKYWLKGSICTQVILEDRSPSLSYDLGWDAYKPLHPIFVVTLYPGAPNITRVEIILENMWVTKLEDQSYSLALKSGSNVLYSKATFTQYAGTRWRKDFWVGTTPGVVSIDYNLAYITYSKALPNFDLSKVVSQSTIDGEASAFSSSDQGDINGKAFWEKYMPQTGGREDIGLFPAWYVRFLYTFSPKLYPAFLGNAAVSGYVPIHLRESDSTLKYDDQRAVDAFGKPFSVDARPSSTPIKVATTSGAHGWTPDIAHHGSFAYVPYLITGDWYFLEEIYQYAAWSIRSGDPTTLDYGRHGDWGIMPYSLQTRGVAWSIRDVAHAAFAAPDGTPEKNYFVQKLNNNIAMREGEQNITDGAFYDPSPSSKWYWGRNTVGEGKQNPLHFMNKGDVYGSLDEMNPDTSLASRAQYIDSPWQYNYSHLVFGHIDELGFPITRLKQVLLLNLLHQLQDPAYNPYLAGTYRMPVRQASTSSFYQTWSDVLNAYSPTVKVATAWPENDEINTNHGYPHILKAAASFLPGINDGSLSGQNAWNWVFSHVAYQDLEAQSPRWSLLPRGQTSVIPPPPGPVSKCDLDSNGLTDSVDVQVSINQALSAAPCSSSDLDGDGKCNVVDVQRVVNAATGGACKIGP